MPRAGLGYGSTSAENRLRVDASAVSLREDILCASFYLTDSWFRFAAGLSMLAGSTGMPRGARGPSRYKPEKRKAHAEPIDEDAAAAAFRPVAARLAQAGCTVAARGGCSAGRGRRRAVL